MKKILLFIALVALTTLVYGQTAQVAYTPTVTASSAYSAGNLVGGKMTFPILRNNNGGGILMSALLVDASNQKQAMTVILFSQNPSHTTFTDKAAFAINAADIGYVMRVISIATTDYVSVGTVAFADVSAIGKAIQGADASTNIYAALITTGTPTFGSTSAITLKLGCAKDQP